MQRWRAMLAYLIEMCRRHCIVLVVHTAWAVLYCNNKHQIACHLFCVHICPKTVQCIVIITDTTSNLSCTCSVLELVHNCLDCQPQPNHQQQNLTLQFFPSSFRHQQLTVIIAFEMHFSALRQPCMADCAALHGCMLCLTCCLWLKHYTGLCRYVNQCILRDMYLRFNPTVN